MSSQSSCRVELEQIPGAALITDLKGQVQAANRYYRELFGDRGDGPAAPALSSWLVDAAGLLTGLSQQLASGKPVAQATVSAVGGGLVQVQAGYRSSSETQHLLMILHRQPPTAVALPPSLAARLIHDIRSPLNALLGFSRLLQEDAELPETARDFAETISDSARSLSTRIDDCAHIMRTLVSGNGPAQDVLRPADIIQEALRSGSDTAKVQLVDEAGCAQRIITDEAQLRLLLDRMLRCAQPAPEAPVKLACCVTTATSGQLALQISLWPCGPQDSHADRHPAAIDLAFCQQLARYLGGQIDIADQRLEVVIPVQAAPASGDKPAPPPPREMARLEPELLSALVAAAQRGDLDALGELLPEVHAHDPVLAQQLNALIERYDYPAIDRLLAAAEGPGGD